MKSEEKIKELINGLGGKDEMAKDVVTISDPITALRNNTANFISQRFDKLKEDTDFAVFLREAAKDKIKEGEVSLSEISTMLNQTRMRETEAVESLLQFFKPAANVENSIFTNRKEEDSSYDLDHKSIKTLDLLRRLLNEVEKQKESPKGDKE